MAPVNRIVDLIMIFNSGGIKNDAGKMQAVKALQVLEYLHLVY